jgi:hypothetical protein
MAKNHPLSYWINIFKNIQTILKGIAIMGIPVFVREYKRWLF